MRKRKSCCNIPWYLIITVLIPSNTDIMILTNYTKYRLYDFISYNRIVCQKMFM